MPLSTKSDRLITNVTNGNDRRPILIVKVFQGKSISKNIEQKKISLKLRIAFAGYAEHDQWQATASVKNRP